MIGADKFYKLFSSPKQIGRLYLLPGWHARGATFQIYLLPKGEDALVQYTQNPPTNINMVEVYGVTGGQLGWTETYGWLHHGQWEVDFMDAVDGRMADLAASRLDLEARKNEDDIKAEDKINRLLSDY